MPRKTPAVPQSAVCDTARSRTVTPSILISPRVTRCPLCDSADTKFLNLYRASPSGEIQEHRKCGHCSEVFTVDEDGMAL